MIDELYEEVKDMESNDPSAMEKIRQHLLSLNDEDEEYMQLLIQEIGDTEIYWERPWYQMHRSLTRPLKVKGTYEDTIDIFKLDSLNSDEMKLLNKNWRKLIKKFNVPDKPLSFARWRNKMKDPTIPEEKVRYFITAYLARGLQRSLYQVYKHIVANFGAPVKGAYSYKEEKIMDICFENDPQNAVTICAMVLSREPRGLYKKLNLSLYGEKFKKKKLKWTLPLANKFLKLLMEYTNLSLEDLKNRKFEKDVWLKLEEDMDQHYVYLQKFWNCSLHVQLFVKDNVTLRKLRKKIYKKLKTSSYKVWSDIRWKEVRNMFPDGYTHHFLYAVAYRGFVGLPNYFKIPLQEALEHAFNNIKKYRYRYDKTLRKLSLDKKGNLITVNISNT